MKKTITYLLTIITLVTSMCLTAYAEDTDFLEECRANHTYILAEDKVKINGFEKLWDDRSVITEEEINALEENNKAYEDDEDMYMALKLKVTYLQPFFVTYHYDASTKEETKQIYPNSMIAEDASLTALCTEANYEAAETIKNTNHCWYVLSVEKYNERMDGYVGSVKVACDSLESYEVSFTIPSEYSKSADLRMIRISNGQVSYVDDIDSDEATYTVNVTGSAAYAFAGTKEDKNDGMNTSEADIGYITEPTQVPADNNASNTIETDKSQAGNDSNRSGKVTAPQTGDKGNLPLVMLSALFGCLAMVCLRKVSK